MLNNSESFVEMQEDDFNKFVKAVLKSMGYDKNKKTTWKEIRNDPKIKEIISLSLHDKGMKFVPPEIGELVNLKNLCLSKNSLTFLPVEINKLTKLSTLVLDKNNFVTLSNEIKLSNLMNLELRYNKFEKVPNLNNFPNLLAVYLHSNLIEEIPSASVLDSHKNLRVLYLKYNPLVINSSVPISSRVHYQEVIINPNIISANHRFEDV